MCGNGPLLWLPLTTVAELGRDFGVCGRLLDGDEDATLLRQILKGVT
jgi:hypothetical protein